MPPPFFIMMNIQEVSDIIRKITEGFEDNAMQCLESHADDIVNAVKEQINSGQNGAGKLLSPTYDDDPFFEEAGKWYHRNKAYKAWKYTISPPAGSTLLGLPARPDNVPNLYITGKFYSEINATRQGNMLIIDPGSGNGPDIVRKYGTSLLDIGDSAIIYINREFMLPEIERFFNACGYR